MSNPELHQTKSIKHRQKIQNLKDVDKEKLGKVSVEILFLADVSLFVKFIKINILELNLKT